MPRQAEYPGRRWETSRSGKDRSIFGWLFLVLVDFAWKDVLERPDFYVLDAMDWRKVVEAEAGRYTAKHPERRAEVSPMGVLTLPDEVNKAGKAYVGCGVRVEHVATHKEDSGQDRILPSRRLGRRNLMCQRSNS